MPLLGAHMSIAGNPHKALMRGEDAGCQVIQIFTRNRLKWSAKGLSESEIDAFQRARTKTSIIPIAIHASYLINLASPRSDRKERTLLLFINEIEWAEQLDIPFLVIHPGSHMGDGEKKGFERIAEMINVALDRTSGYNVKILVETTAGQGTNLGYRFEHLAEIMELAGFSDRLGVCFDTCHTFAAGYDFRNKEAYRQVIQEFDNLIGVDRLRLFHINDSKNGPGSRVDRHDNLGEGLIGLKSFSFFLNDPLFAEHFFLLETPKGTDAKGINRDVVNLELLRSIMMTNQPETDNV
ncbi:deoxyribonuclease IV [Thermodesulfobacteriota bacterium]